MSFSRLLSRLAPWSWVPALILWAVAVIAWLTRLLTQASEPHRNWLFDWHVYSAGARDFVAGDLYKIVLASPFPIPVDAYNMPPGSAVITLPLLIFPDEIAGPMWVILNVAAV